MEPKERTYHTLRRNDGSVVVYYTLDNDPAYYVVYDTLDAHPLAAEVARLQAQVEAMREAATGLIAYRDKAGPLNFQLEKADDFIGRLRAALGGER